MKLLGISHYVVLCSTPVRAFFVQKEPQALRSALLETSLELRQVIEGFTVDPTGDLLGTVAKLITDTMIPGILSTHNSTQHQLDAFGQAFSSCPSPTISTQATMLIQTRSVPSSSDLLIQTRSPSDLLIQTRSVSGFPGDHLVRRRRTRRREDRRRRTTTPTTTTTTTVLGDPQWIAAEMGALAQCRQKEAEAAVKNQDCQKAMSILEGVKNSTCNSLKALETVPLAPNLCEPTTPYEQWLISANETTHALKASLAEKKDGCGNATQLYDDKAPECGATKSQHDGNKTECDRLQAQAEAGICAGPLPAQKQVCDDYGICYDAALLAYQEQEPKIKAMQLNWTVQWRTLKRMECLLGVMQSGGTNDDVDKCKDKLWTTDHLNLVYPTIPEKEVCPGTASGAGTAGGEGGVPCEAAFTTKYYDNNPPGAPAAACTPCPTVAPVAPVAPPVQTAAGALPAGYPYSEWMCHCKGLSGHGGMSVYERLGSSSGHQLPGSTVRLGLAGAADVEYFCDDGTVANCPNDKQCYRGIESWPKSDLDSEDTTPCLKNCKCSTPGAGYGEEHNQFHCVDGTHYNCQADQECVEEGIFNYKFINSEHDHICMTAEKKAEWRAGGGLTNWETAINKHPKHGGRGGGPWKHA